MNSTQKPNAGAAPGKVKDPVFTEILTALAAWKFPEGIDGVVAIANAGIVPGVLVAQKLGVGLKTIGINYRNEVDEPQFAQPQLQSSVPGIGDWQRVLLVDDIYLSGKSWAAARAHLPKSVEVLPFVLMGNTDFALIRCTNTSVHWPWNPH